MNTKKLNALLSRYQLTCCEVETLIEKRILSVQGKLLSTETVMLTTLRYLRNEIAVKEAV